MFRQLKEIVRPKRYIITEIGEDSAVVRPDYSRCILCGEETGLYYLCERHEDPLGGDGEND